jgi:hypothetical protein
VKCSHPFLCTHRDEVGIVGLVFCGLLLPLAAYAQPAGSAEFGIEQRVRNENWNNLFDYNGAANDEREQIRYRTRVWTRLPISSFIDLNIGLNSETNQKLGLNSVVDEVIFETANINIRKLFAKGLSLKVGRQDIIRGEGLVLLEGDPGDGSRSTYFNAAVLAYAFRKSTLEAMGILNPHADRMLPRFNDQHKALNDGDEQALGLYYTDKNVKDLSVEAYYFHKKEVNSRLAHTSVAYQPDRRFETMGGRAVRGFGKLWTATGEGAAQWGEQRPGTPIRAWAAYGYVKRAITAPWKPYVTGGFWALSGDDPARKDRISGWDPLFSRWPKWGDLELYSGVPEKGVGYATNQKRLQLETGITPSKRLSAKFIYYRVTAFHPFAGSANVFGKGEMRGNNIQARMDFVVNQYMKGHVDYETLLPGDFYAHNGRSYFLRFEMTAQAKATVTEFKHRVFGK